MKLSTGGAMVTEIEKAHVRLAASLGNFVMTWSNFELIIDVGIKKQLGLDPKRAVIVTSGLRIRAEIEHSSVFT